MPHIKAPADEEVPPPPPKPYPRDRSEFAAVQRVAMSDDRLMASALADFAGYIVKGGALDPRMLYMNGWVQGFVSAHAQRAAADIEEDDGTADGPAPPGTETPGYA